MRHCLRVVLTGVLLFSLLPSAPVSAASAGRSAPSAGVLLEIATGKASYYSDKLHKRKTANGERYDKTSFTAAHRTLPMGTVVRVTNLHNGRDVLVRINDRGPVKKEWLIDLSRAAASRLDMMRRGVARVQVEVVSNKRGICRRENGFFVNVRSVASEEEGRAQLQQLLASSGKPRGRAASAGQGNRSAGPFADARKALAAAEVFTCRDASGKSRCFLGLGPFSSFHEAEKIRQRIGQARAGKTGAKENAVLVCLPLRHVASSVSVATDSH